MAKKKKQKRSNAQLVLLALIAFTVIAWLGLLNNKTTQTNERADLLSAADEFEANEIYKMAAQKLERYLELEPKSYDTMLRLAEDYFLFGDTNGFIGSCDRAISIDKTREEPYALKADYYIEQAQYAEAIKVLDAAERVVTNNPKLKAIRDSLHGKYVEKYLSATELGEWIDNGKNSYLTVGSDEKWGLVLQDGKSKIRQKFGFLGAYSEADLGEGIAEGILPCEVDGEWYYIDLDGDKRLIGKEAYEYLGAFCDEYAPAQRAGTWGYITPKFEEKSFIYTYAGAFSEGVAAVKKGEMWALLDSKLKEITSFEFDDISIDANGFCARYGLVVVRRGTKSYLYDTKAKTISEKGFDELRMPASEDGAIAAKTGDFWGFIDRSGKEILAPEFEDADSFSMGFAPVQVQERWGYIDASGAMVIEAKFFEARSFTSKGVAAVKSNSYGWNLIVLCEYDIATGGLF